MMVELGHSVTERTKITTQEVVEFDGDGNVNRVRTTSPRDDAAELYVCAKVWARWADVTKHACITLNQSISYRDFFAACLAGIKGDPNFVGVVIAALSSTERLRQFAGEQLWKVWCLDNEPRAHLLRMLVREELDCYRKEYQH